MRRGNTPGSHRVHHVHRENSKIHKRATVDREYHNELRVRKLMFTRVLFLSSTPIPLNFKMQLNLRKEAEQIFARIMFRNKRVLCESKSFIHSTGQYRMLEIVSLRYRRHRHCRPRSVL